MKHAKIGIMAQINGYNILFKQGEKLFAGTTSNTFTLTPKVKESLTKEDEGTTNKVVTGYDTEFTVDGVMELNEEGQEENRLDREDIIALVKAGVPLDFVYGNPAAGSKVQKGKMIVTSYSETTNAEGEATYSLSCSGVSKLTEETIPAE